MKRIHSPSGLFEKAEKRCKEIKGKFTFLALKESIDEFVKDDLKNVAPDFYHKYEEAKKNGTPIPQTYRRFFKIDSPCYITFEKNPFLVDILFYYAENMSWKEFADRNNLDINSIDADIEIKKIEARKNSNRSVTKKLNHLDNRIKNKINALHSKLEDFDNNDKIDEGIAIANDEYEIYKDYLYLFPKILHKILKFNILDQNWPQAKKIANEIMITNCSEIPTCFDEALTTCIFALCESELREAYILENTNCDLARKNINQAKDILQKTPISQRNFHRYYYWLGKCNLDYWYINGKENIGILKKALTAFEDSVQRCNTWWCLCYISIIKKILFNKGLIPKNPILEINAFVQEIFNLPKHLIKRSSVRTYKITSFLLREDKKGLKEFLARHKNDTPRNDFNSTIFYHAKMIFLYDNEKYIEYKRILETWIANAK